MNSSEVLIQGNPQFPRQCYISTSTYGLLSNLTPLNRRKAEVTVC